jgi:hypothetical protein
LLGVFAAIVQQLCGDCAAIVKRILSYCAANSNRLRSDFASIAQRFRIDFAAIAFIHHSLQILHHYSTTTTLPSPHYFPQRLLESNITVDSICIGDRRAEKNLVRAVSRATGAQLFSLSLFYPYYI